MNRKTKKQKLASLFYLIPVALTVALTLSGVLDGLSLRTEDAAYQKAGIPSPSVYVIGIDEETLSEYGQFENWSREKITELIGLLSSDEKYRPAVIALDIGFYGEKDPATDAALVEAVKKAGNVVLVSNATFGTVLSDSGRSYTTETVLLEEPFPALREAAAAVGHSNVQLDSDGVARHALGSITYNGEARNAFAYEIYRTAGGTGSEFGGRPGWYYITYSGKPRDYFGAGITGCSLRSVLNGTYRPETFRGAVVLVGAYASGMQDNYYTSVDRSQQMYGVEIHANILVQLMNGTCKRETGKTERLLAALALCAAVAVLLIFVDTKISVPASVLTGVLYYAAARLLYSKADLILPLLVPLAGAAGLVITHILVRYFTVHREKKRIIASYGKYLSPEVAATIADTGEEALKLGGTKKDISVLFVDIRGFTSLSETLTPEKVVEMLNTYLSVTTKSIFDNKGTVDKFIGDATMGVFNAPLDLDDYTFRSVCAGLEMAELAKGLDEKLSPELRGRVGFGVGINCGDAVVGNIGTSFRMEYTAIGDTVNTASRLEGQAKAGWVVISDAVYERVRDRIRCEDLGQVKLKGKAEPVQIWKACEVIGGAPWKKGGEDAAGETSPNKER